MNNWTNDVIITTRREAGIPDADILELINRSYKIWAEHELDGPFLHYTVEDFQQATRQANVFVAIERATGKLLGTHTLQARRREGCVHGSLLAVAPEARGRGIASRMLEREAERVRKAEEWLPHYRLSTGPERESLHLCVPKAAAAAQPQPPCLLPLRPRPLLPPPLSHKLHRYPAIQGWPREYELAWEIGEADGAAIKDAATNPRWEDDSLLSDETTYFL